MPVLLFLLWMLLNGRITAEIVLFGFAVTALAVWFMHKTMGYTLRTDLRLFRNAGILSRYTAVLVREIVKASLLVMKESFSPSGKPDPVIVEFHSGLKSRFANELLANTITLTPGTYTVFQKDDRFIVHCLKREYADGMDDFVFIKILSGLR